MITLNAYYGFIKNTTFKVFGLSYTSYDMWFTGLPIKIKIIILKEIKNSLKSNNINYQSTKKKLLELFESLISLSFAI